MFVYDLMCYVSCYVNVVNEMVWNECVWELIFLVLNKLDNMFIFSMMLVKIWLVNVVIVVFILLDDELLEEFEEDFFDELLELELFLYGVKMILGLMMLRVDLCLRMLFYLVFELLDLDILLSWKMFWLGRGEVGEVCSWWLVSWVKVGVGLRWESLLMFLWLLVFVVDDVSCWDDGGGFMVLYWIWFVRRLCRGDVEYRCLILDGFEKLIYSWFFLGDFERKKKFFFFGNWDWV